MSYSRLKHLSQILRDGWFSIAYANHIVPTSRKIRERLHLVPSRRGVCWRYLDRYRVFALPWPFSLSPFPLLEAIRNYVNPLPPLLARARTSRVIKPQTKKFFPEMLYGDEYRVLSCIRCIHVPYNLLHITLALQLKCLFYIVLISSVESRA